MSYSMAWWQMPPEVQQIEDWRRREAHAFERGCWFHANISAMAFLRGEMRAQQMVEDVEPEIPELHLDDPETEAPLRREPAGIAYYKLCSNDGFWVRKNEIRAALSRAREYPLGSEAVLVEEPVLALISSRQPGITLIPGPVAWNERIELWRRWLHFLEGASNHGGFEIW